MHHQAHDTPTTNQQSHLQSAQPVSANEFHLFTVDGGGKTGWAHFVVDTRAFSRPENKVMRWLIGYEHGEVAGDEYDQIRKLFARIRGVMIAYPSMGVSPMMVKVVAEDFDLVQTHGDKENLLSPVRINATLAYLCRERAIKFAVQSRALRVKVTRERLRAFGFEGSYKKDEFAAMQHGVTHLRLLKRESLSNPWKLSDGTVLNAYWDCVCADGKRGHDLDHPDGSGMWTLSGTRVRNVHSGP